jgi:hypothetical protein
MYSTYVFLQCLNLKKEDTGAVQPSRLNRDVLHMALPQRTRQQMKNCISSTVMEREL